ncbi:MULTISPECIES: hypothetical protein [Actinomycetes]|uniref:hypothetical protein n=1 Tax=Actinomycetes TaxID=1760 RepID=UPI00341A2F7E
MTLRSLAQELTEPHMKMIGGRIGKVPALIDELASAIYGSSDTGAGGSSSKVGILVNAQALDLHQKIERDIKRGYTIRFKRGAPTLKRCVKTISNTEHEPDWEDWFTHLFQSVASEIETMLRPKKLRRLDGVTCPSCGQATYSEDRLTALYVDCWADNENLKPHQEWSVECNACGTHWNGTNEIKWVLVALTANNC